MTAQHWMRIFTLTTFLCSMPWLQWAVDQVDWNPANMKFDELEVKHLLALAAVGLTTVYAIRKVRQKKYHLPPGPYAFPIVGNLLCEWTFTHAHAIRLIICFIDYAIFWKKKTKTQQQQKNEKKKKKKHQKNHKKTLWILSIKKVNLPLKLKYTVFDKNKMTELSLLLVPLLLLSNILSR